MSKTITLLTSGTRGDVAPYIALGEGLRDMGYNVRIAAPRGFANLFNDKGGKTLLQFSPFDGNPTDLMIEQGDFTPFTIGTNPIRSIQAPREFLQKARPLYRHMLHTAAEACRGSDLLIHGLPTIWGAHIAEGLGIPAVRALLQPLAPTREFPSALMPFRFSLSGIGNWLSHWAVTQATWLSWRSEINHARHADFGLGPAHWLDPSLRADSHQPSPSTVSANNVVPRPRDWNEKQIITGYWRSPSETGYRNSRTARVSKISSIRQPHRHRIRQPGHTGIFAHARRSLEHCGCPSRADHPFQMAWRNKIKEFFPIEYVPHDWLYPRVRVAIHHGGAGTTSASLHAGIPTITLPLAIDQFFWGERVHKIGAGLSIPQRKLNAEESRASHHAGIDNESMNARAKTLSVALSQENGIQAAVSVIEA
jgi:sterol 3beta-glucosyltransferase